MVWGVCVGGGEGEEECQKGKGKGGEWGRLRRGKLDE